MRHRLIGVGVGVACLVTVAFAQMDDASVSEGLRVSAERQRIAVERAEANARFERDKTACYQRFSVNDCIVEARARRRDVVSDLRRQELVLNDLERRRRAGEQLQRIEDKQTGAAARPLFPASSPGRP